MKVAKTILYYSRAPKPTELDGVHYHFRSREAIEALPAPRFVTFPVRDHVQALDLAYPPPRGPYFPNYPIFSPTPK